MTTNGAEKMNDVTDAELGRLIADHEAVHGRVAELRAELTRIGALWTQVGGVLAEHPENLRQSAAAAVVLSAADSVAEADLRVSTIVEMAAELRDAMVREHELAEGLIEAGKRYVVDGLRSRREPPAERDLFSRMR
ncbi:MAG: hypothetical protein OXF79_04710 [Chloroflexi bacterium]|nr:hypothetical protein [Chloroflexota bacterium]